MEENSMTKFLFALISFCVTEVLASTWTPDDRFLNALSHVESSGGRFVWGDHGRSLGEFQISRAAWNDVSNWRKARGLPTFSYRAHVFNPEVNREYAIGHLTMLHRELTRALRREPTPAEIYAGYNLGLTRFGEACGYDMRRINKTTATKCRQIMAFLQTKR
jgi:hypothetical protein